MPSAVLDPLEATRRIESSAQIHMHAFEVALGVLTGLAILCFIARMTIRLVYQRRLGLDDWFLILAAACLIAATGILYHIRYFLYLHSAALMDPGAVIAYLFEDFEQLLDLQKKVYPFLALIWTTTYAVKGCFLVFMRPLVWHISRGVNWYYWFIVGLCILSWAFAQVMPFIICPYFGVDALQCFNSTVNPTKTTALTAVVTVLDVFTDIMVVSIPIIVLRKSTLSRSTKAALAMFLCLSIFMAIVAIIRMSGFYYKGLEDDVWEFFWQQTEGAVAVMMASITAFRTLFIIKQNDNNNRMEAEVHAKSPQPSGSFRGFVARFKALAKEQPGKKPTSGSTILNNNSTFILKLPKLPSPVLTGIRTFIRGSSQVGASVAGSESLDSVYDNSDIDYHVVIKAETESTNSSKPHSRGSP